ncbi:conserved protein of unknown function [Ectopseudomonas oleovorans]|uniref:Uncharacterized protein n=1 Tax=Ectopseudomonas oleovorans TaxID=301 RepID=A0A653B4J8_ECTOL|nr:conserved protein of unknown function [Pseudomonas oleovorans]
MAAADLPFRRPRPAEARLPVAADRTRYRAEAFFPGRLIRAVIHMAPERPAAVSRFTA